MPGLAYFLFRCYREADPGSTVDANNPTKGAPLGCWDTLFITASSLEQRLLAPLIVGVLTDLRVARFLQAGGADLLLVLDDMPTLAPDRDLPDTMAQSGGQGLLIFGIYHDDAQLRAKWGDEGCSTWTLRQPPSSRSGPTSASAVPRACATSGSTRRWAHTATPSAGSFPDTGQPLFRVRPTT